MKSVIGLRARRARLAGALLHSNRRAEQTMVMPQTAGTWTADMVRAIPDDGNRYEVVDGELLVTPSPRGAHQPAVLELAVLLRAYVLEQRIGEAWISPSDIELDSRSLVQPDVFVFGGVTREWNNPDVPLLLVAEVLSPSSMRADRTIKRRRYQRAGIPEYWILSLAQRHIERWRPQDDRPEIARDFLVWHPAAAADALRIDVPALFGRSIEGLF